MGKRKTSPWGKGRFQKKKHGEAKTKKNAGSLLGPKAKGTIQNEVGRTTKSRGKVSLIYQRGGNQGGEGLKKAGEKGNAGSEGGRSQPASTAPIHFTCARVTCFQEEACGSVP